MPDLEPTEGARPERDARRRRRRRDGAASPPPRTTLAVPSTNGRSLDSAVEDDWSDEEERRYRWLYEHRDRHLGSLPFREARTAYRVGRVAARNPALEGKAFGEVEPSLVPGWGEERWRAVRPFVRLGFERLRFDERLERSRRSVERLERVWRERNPTAP